MDLLLISLFSLLLMPVVMLTTGPLRIALGLPFVLFFPGYALIAALFVRKNDLDGIQRVALSFGLSIATVPLIGLALNYTPWGIRLSPVLISLLLFIIVMAVIARYRRQQVTPEERFEIRTRLDTSYLSQSWLPQNRWGKVLTLLLLVAIAGAIGMLGYVVAKPKVGEEFTEFYILGEQRDDGTVVYKAEGYPRELAVGEEGRVLLGVVNHEHETAFYRMEIAIDGETVDIGIEGKMLPRIGPITLNHEEKWERDVSFAPTRAGLNQKVQFLLYKGESDEPYRSLHLWIDVEGPR